MLNNYKKELIKIYESEKPKLETDGKLRRVFNGDFGKNSKNGDKFDSFFNIKDAMQKLTEDEFSDKIPKELEVEYKLGLPFNISQQPWIFIHDENNSKPSLSSSVYIGINLNIDGVDKNDGSCEFENKKGYSAWIGMGITGVKQKDMYNNRISLINKMKQVIGEKLEHGFYYVESKEDNVGISIRKDSRIEESFEEDLKYLSELYLKFVTSDVKYDITKNTIVKANTNLKALSYIHDKYLKHISENNYSTITYNPDYKIFLENISLIIKKAISNPKEEYYLIINDISAFDNGYLSELKTLLLRNYIFNLNNTYLSKLIFGKDNMKVFLPNNLYVMFTSTNNTNKKDIEEVLNIINVN